MSVASLWEIVVKLRIGKLKADISAIERAVVREGFTRLGIETAHLQALATLPSHHRDPFDHLLVVQAMIEDASLLSDDVNVTRYPVTVMRS